MKIEDCRQCEYYFDENIGQVICSFFRVKDYRITCTNTLDERIVLDCPKKDSTNRISKKAG
jgi:hypothetical protein